MEACYVTEDRHGREGSYSRVDHRGIYNCYVREDCYVRDDHRGSEDCYAMEDRGGKKGRYVREDRSSRVDCKTKIYLPPAWGIGAGELITDTRGQRWSSCFWANNLVTNSQGRR